MSLLQELETAVDFYYQLHQHDEAIEKAKLDIVTLNKERYHTVKKAGKKAQGRNLILQNIKKA